MAKTLTIDQVTRIEGHARVTLDVDGGGNVVNGQLHVQEIRGFEKFLEHMELQKMPLVTSRICGVCPAAHHLVSAIAIEQGAKAAVPAQAQALRELLYMGHILHSHALSCFVLIGPDLLSGIGASPQNRSIFFLLSKSPEVAKKMLRLRSIGQYIVEAIGGRGVHPVTVIPGGIASQPSSEDMKKIAEWGKESLALLEELHPVVSQALSKLSDVREAAKMDGCAMALSQDGQVSFLRGKCQVIDAQGKAVDSFDAAEYAEHLVEHVMPGSYMKSVRLRGSTEKSYYVGPLARLNVNRTFSTPKASALLDQFKSGGAARTSAVDNIEARMIEMVHCAERIVILASAGAGSGALSAKVKLVEGRYIGLIEAPRGILIHDYTADANGMVTSANLIVATQNNYDAMNATIVKLARHFKPQNDDNLLMNGVEFALRCFDPCLACATHASGKMPLTIQLCQRGTIVRTITREVTHGR